MCFLQKIASLAYLDISMVKCINKDQPKMKGMKHICTIYSLIARQLCWFNSADILALQYQT